MRFTYTTTLLVGLGLLLSAPAQAVPTPKQIVDRAMKQQVLRNRGAQMKIQLDIKSPHGERRQRSLAARTLRRDGISKSLARVLGPRDVAGLAFLFRQNKGGADDQFMYLPAVKMVKRIAGSQKNSKFLGSQFTYGDLEWSSVERATYRALPDENLGRDACHVIEARPRDSDQYSSLRLWIRKKDASMLRAQFYNRKGKLKKVLFVKRVERVGGQLMATRLKMKNKKTGASTVLTVSEIKLRDDFKDEGFSVRALKK